MKDITEGYMDILKELLEKANVIVEESGATYDESFSSLLYSLSSFQSLHHFKQFCADNFGLLSVKSLRLGSETRSVGEMQNRRATLIDHNMYYIPLQSTLQNLANFTTFFDLHYDVNLPKNIYHDVCSGNAFTSYPKKLLQLNGLKLIFFYDELEICNPLGSYSKTHKLAVLYFTFANIPPPYRSRLSSIFVYAIMKSQELQPYGYDAILKPLIEEINELSENGLPIVKSDGEKICVTGFLACIVADTLGAHQLLGLKEGVGFSNKK